MLQQIDMAILEWIRESFAHPWLTPLFKGITFFGEYGAGWILIALTLLAFKKTRKIGWTMGIALLAGFLLGEVFLKNVIARPRPFTLLPELPLWIPVPHGFSCPSGHTTSSFAAATTIFLYNKKWGTVALVLAGLIGFSRMYFTVHYLTDVLFGVVLGVGCALLAYALLRRRKTNG